MLALYWVQIATFLVPLVTLPYLSRVLGPSAFGLVIFSQSFSIFLTLFVDWGFTPYGVRKVAADRDDPQALATTVAQVRTAQILLAAQSVPLAIGVLVLVPKFSHHPEFLVMAWVAAVAGALMPNWFFVGAERVRLTAVLQLGCRAVGAAFTLALVHRPRDAWIVMALFMASSLAMWIFSDILLYRRVPFRLVGIRAAAASFAEATRLFIGTVAVSLFSTFNVVLLGLYVSSAQVAQFGASERIVRTWEQILGPIGTAVYPRLAFLHASGRHHRARKLAVISISVMGGIGALVAIVLGVFAATWVRIIFGPKFVHDGAPLLRILVLLIPSNVVGYIAAVWLMTVRRDRTLLRIAVAAGLLNVGLGSLLSQLVGAQGMAWSVVVVQFLASGAAWFAVYRISDSAGAFFTQPPQEGEPRPRGGIGVMAVPPPESRAKAPVE